MTVFVGQEMVNFPAPQKLDPKISPHGIHTIYDMTFSCPTKTRPQAQNRAKTVVFSMFMQNPKQQA